MSQSEVQSDRFNGSAEDVAPLGRSLRAENRLSPEEQALNDEHDQALEAARRDAMSGTDEAKTRKDAHLRAFVDGVKKLSTRLDSFDPANREHLRRPK